MHVIRKEVIVAYYPVPCLERYRKTTKYLSIVDVPTLA
jgi:hypothetical protein